MFREFGSIIFTYDNQTTYLTIVTLVSSTVGIALSIFAFALLILTAALFAEWRHNYKNQLIIQFMLARLLYTICRYVFDIRNVFNLCDGNCFVYLNVLSLTYTECALISWMFVFSKLMNDSLVKVFNVPKTPIWKISVYTWLVPAIISCMFYLVNIRRKERELLNFLLYLFLFKWPVLCANAVLLIQALTAILNTNQSRTESNTRIIVVMIILIFVFSFQQILVDTYKIVNLIIRDEYNTYLLAIINILAIYHGAFSITFWLFGNANTRKLWRYRNSNLAPQMSIRSN